jgi:peroxiredoxin
MVMMLKANQPAPDFMVKDIWGINVQLSSFKGKKSLLTFYRHVGCPVNHLRFLELQKLGDFFKKRNLVIIAIYESCTENLQLYSKDEQFHAQLIANPELDLYGKYYVEQNTLKFLFSMYKGVFSKVQAGKKLLKHQFEHEGYNNL